jgi:hypothetical protein
MLAAQLASRRISHTDYGVRARELAPEVQNTFRKLQLLKSRRGVTVDQVGEILARRFDAPATGWRVVLEGEYMHLLRILVQADALFDPSPTQWLQLQNSFNDALCRSLIGLLARHGMPGSAKLIARDGKLVKLGALLQAGAPFATHHPRIADPFRRANDRRNSLPASHPYDEKRGVRNCYLSSREQKQLVRDLRAAYTAAIALANAMP